MLYNGHVNKIIRSKGENDMKMTLRWFGTGHDSVKLSHIRQIPGVKGVITTLYDTKPGEVWSRERIRAMKAGSSASGTSMRS